ncbi:MAG: DUF1189 family protein [Proteobacteria bacterium]|nr:DUF1189 family protein [Pseudomonadota bacterium]MBU1714944.1 DUF1189 family protein [Pseudomonadota bacterium]
MADSRYMIVFQGRIIPGLNAEQVKQNLQQRFKLSNTQVDNLFSGRNIALKKNLSHEMALAFQKILLDCGASSIISLMPIIQKNISPVEIQTDKTTSPPKDSALSAKSVSPAIQNDPIYRLFAPIYLSFYSSKFYNNIAHQWNLGRAFAYMFLLVVLTQLPLIGYNQIKFNNFKTEYSDLVPQIPEIRRQGDSLTTDCEGPCVLQHAGQDFLIIDPIGDKESLSASSAMILVNAESILIKDTEDRVKSERLPTGFDFHINRQIAEQWLPVCDWLWALLIFILIPGVYLFFCLKALFYGGIGMLMAKRHLDKPVFATVLVLTIICLTPVGILNMVLNPILGGTPLLAAVILTMFVLNLALRQHAQGERDRAAAKPNTVQSNTSPESEAPKTLTSAGHIKFHYGNNFSYFIFAFVTLTIIPFLLMILQVNSETDSSAMLSMLIPGLIVSFAIAFAVILLMKKTPVATLDETVLSLSQMTIPWSKLTGMHLKTKDFGLFQWRTLVLKGTFKAPLTGNTLYLPLMFVEQSDKLIEAVSQRIGIIDNSSIRLKASKRHPTQQDELRYKNIRFTPAGIFTRQNNVSWEQVRNLVGQANVIAGLGSLTLQYIDGAGRNRSLVVPAECTKTYQEVVSCCIDRARKAEIDPELLKVLETNVDEARANFQVIWLGLLSVILFVVVGIILAQYKFSETLGTLMIGGIIPSIILLTVVSTKKEAISLKNRKLIAWGAASLPVAALLLGLFFSPDSRHWLMGDITAKVGSFETAEGHYRQALALSGNNYDIMFDLGILYMNQGQWEKAFNSLDAPLRDHISDWTPEAVLFAPEMLMRMGKREEAIGWCEEILQNPKIPTNVARVIDSKLQELRSGMT